MASRGSRPKAVAPRGLTPAGCSGSSALGAPSCADPAPGPRPAQAPGGPEGAGGCLRRSVLSERERRKRISASCERLRALLPGFDGRREDMASVLEMAVQFLQLAGALVPGGAPQAAALSEPPRSWERDVSQLVLAEQTPAGALDLRPALAAATTGAPSLAVSTRRGAALSPGSRQQGGQLPGVLRPAASRLCTVGQQGPLSCGAATVGQDGALLGTAKELDGPAAALGPPSPLPWSPAPSPPGALRLPPSQAPQGSEAARSCQARSLPAGRPGPGCDVDDKMSLLLAGSPDWWPGDSLARSSQLDGVEPGFPEDPTPLEPSGPDTDCPGLALGDEADGIFPNFLSCWAAGRPGGL